MQFRRPPIAVFTFAGILMFIPAIGSSRNPVILVLPLFLLMLLGVLREAVIEFTYYKEDKLVNGKIVKRVMTE